MACDFCDDVFAECADAVFMDAWLPNYSSDWRGHSIMLIRNSDLSSLFSSNDECYLQSIGINQVVRSQLGVLDDKRGNMSLRYNLALDAGSKPPPRRDHLWRAPFQLGRRQVVTAQWNIARRSPHLWSEANGSYELFLKAVGLLRTEMGRAKQRMASAHYFNSMLRRLLGG